MNRRGLLGSSAAVLLGARMRGGLRVAAQTTPHPESNPDFRILFIRHAESQLNVLRTIDVPGALLPPDSGVTYPLTQAGVEQAIALAEQLRDTNLLAIYSSTRLRAVQTADAVAFARAMTIELAPELVEVAFTDPAASMSTVDYVNVVATLTDWITGNPGASAPGGENLNQALARFLPFVDETIGAYAGTAGNLVFVSHSITLGAALPFLFDNVSPAWAMMNGLRNTGVATGAYVNNVLHCIDWQGVTPQ